MHYIDTSEDPSHIEKILTLDAAAKDHDVVVLSGANKVPALSSVVIDAYASEFSSLREIYCGISPSHLSQSERSHIPAITPGLGEPFSRLEGGVWKTVYGWQDLHRRYYGDNVGYRWHANRNVPDLKMLPEKYPELKSVIYHGGIETSGIHWLLGNVAWLRRWKIFKHSSWMTRWLSYLNRWLGQSKKPLMGMYVHMIGVNHEIQPLEIKWNLIAEMHQGDELGAIIALLVLQHLKDKQYPSWSTGLC